MNDVTRARGGEPSDAPESASRAVLKLKISRAFRVTRNDYEVRGFQVVVGHFFVNSWLVHLFVFSLGTWRASETYLGRSRSTRASELGDREKSEMTDRWSQCFR